MQGDRRVDSTVHGARGPLPWIEYTSATAQAAAGSAGTGCALQLISLKLALAELADNRRPARTRSAHCLEDSVESRRPPQSAHAPNRSAHHSTPLRGSPPFAVRVRSPAPPHSMAWSEDSETRKQRLGYGRHARKRTGDDSDGGRYGPLKGKIGLVVFVGLLVVLIWQFPLEHHVRRKSGHHAGGDGGAAATGHERTTRHEGLESIVPRGALPREAAKRRADALAGKAKTLMLLLVSDNEYQKWQMRVFHYHFIKSKQTAKLVTIVSTKDRQKPSFTCDEPHMTCPIFVTDDYSVAPDGDYFVVYNRAWALVEFLKDFRAKQAAGIDSEYTNVVIVEPDFILTTPVTAVARRRTIIGHHYFYMELGYPWANNTDVVRRCTERPDLMSAIGVPYIIHIEDLWQLLPAWIEKTRLCRFPQPWDQDRKSWIADMWGFACAAASLGMEAIADKDLTPEPPMDYALRNRSIALHYTYGQDVGAGKWKFDKRQWNSVPQPRPLPPFPEGASPLQIVWRELLSEALTEVYGPANEHVSIKITNGKAGA